LTESKRYNVNWVPPPDIFYNRNVFFFTIGMPYLYLPYLYLPYLYSHCLIMDTAQLHELPIIPIFICKGPCKNCIKKECLTI
jgi:hypothetical protein